MFGNMLLFCKTRTLKETLKDRDADINYRHGCSTYCTPDKTLFCLETKWSVNARLILR